MNIDFKRMEYYFEEKRSEWKTLFIILIFLLFLFSSCYNFIVDKLNLFKINTYSREVVIIVWSLICLTWIVYWFFYKFHLPRNKKNKVGIVVAIYTENEKEKEKLKMDFISKFKEELREGDILENCFPIFLENHFSYQIKESNDPVKEIEKINKKIKAPDLALESIRKAKENSKNALEWRYSEAFLYFWKGDYKKALKICQKIKNQNYPNEKLTLNEVRAFTLKVIEKNKPQLYFWIGYLAYFKDNNLVTQ